MRPMSLGGCDNRLGPVPVAHSVRVAGALPFEAARAAARRLSAAADLAEPCSMALTLSELASTRFEPTWIIRRSSSGVSCPCAGSLAGVVASGGILAAPRPRPRGFRVRWSRGWPCIGFEDEKLDGSSLRALLIARVSCCEPAVCSPPLPGFEGVEGGREPGVPDPEAAAVRAPGTQHRCRQ